MSVLTGAHLIPRLKRARDRQACVLPGVGYSLFIAGAAYVIDGGTLAWRGVREGCAPTDGVDVLANPAVLRSRRREREAFRDGQPACAQFDRVLQVQAKSGHESMGVGCGARHRQKFLDASSHGSTFPRDRAKVEESVELQRRKSQHRFQKAGQLTFELGPERIVADPCRPSCPSALIERRIDIEACLASAFQNRRGGDH